MNISYYILTDLRYALQIILLILLNLQNVFSQFKQKPDIIVNCDE